MDISYMKFYVYTVRTDCQIVTRSLHLNIACTSAPVLPTWHAQRQVESRRCSAGLTLKHLASSKDRS